MYHQQIALPHFSISNNLNNRKINKKFTPNELQTKTKHKMLVLNIYSMLVPLAVVVSTAHQQRAPLSEKWDG